METAPLPGKSRLIDALNARGVLRPALRSTSGAGSTSSEGGASSERRTPSGASSSRKRVGASLSAAQTTPVHELALSAAEHAPSGTAGTPPGRETLTPQSTKEDLNTPVLWRTSSGGRGRGCKRARTGTCGSSTRGRTSSSQCELSSKGSGNSQSIFPASVEVSELRAATAELRQQLSEVKMREETLESMVQQLRHRAEVAEAAHDELAKDFARAQAENVQLKQEVEAARALREQAGALLAGRRLSTRSARMQRRRSAAHARHRPPVPVFRQENAASLLRQLPLPPKRQEDNYELSDNGEASEEDSLRDNSLDRSAKHTPKWCDAYLEVFAQQVLIDPDTIFGSKVPECDLEMVFDDKLYQVASREVPKRKRGSSGEWCEDRLTRCEIRSYKRKMGQTKGWEVRQDKSVLTAADDTRSESKCKDPEIIEIST